MYHKLFHRIATPFDVLSYEIKMFNETYSLFVTEPYLSPDHKSALLESFLLHTRTLTEFLEGRKTYPDDLTCMDFINENKKPIQGVVLNFDKDFKESLNKFLFHMTTTRITDKPGWDIKKIRQEINFATHAFIEKCSLTNFDNQELKNKALEKLRTLID